MERLAPIPSTYMLILLFMCLVLMLLASCKYKHNTTLNHFPLFFVITGARTSIHVSARVSLVAQLVRNPFAQMMRTLSTLRARIKQ